MTDPAANRFSSVLRVYRKAAQLSQEALAERAGVSVHSISNLERGIPHRPRRDTLELIATALALEPEERATFLNLGRAMNRIRALGGQSLTSAVSNMSRETAGAGYAPRPPTPLVGRQVELHELIGILSRAEGQLVTICGAPGVGKTRLALEVARGVEKSFPDGAYFAPLAPLTDAAYVPAAILASLGTEEPKSRRPLDELIAYVRTKRMLLVLDNFEHLAEAATGVVTELLAHCAQLTILVTSRTVLAVRGEVRYMLLPLLVPDLARLPPLDALLQIPSVMLFFQRMRAIQPQTQGTRERTEQAARTVAAICHRLDGLPLALELAAARTVLLRPETLLERLSASSTMRFDVLAHGPRDLPAHQRALRTTLDWSYDLLSTFEQAVFRSLAVFRGGAPLDAVAAVVEQAVMQRRDSSTPSFECGDVTEALAALIQHSLVQADVSSDDKERMRMLATLREYAGDRLCTDGEEFAARYAHASWCCKFAETAAPQLIGPEQQRWLTRLDDERDNLREALRWALEQHEADLAARLVSGLWRYWLRRGMLSEGRGWAERTIALADAVDLSLPVAGTPSLSRGGQASMGQLLVRVHEPDPDRAVRSAQLHYAAGVFAQFQDDFPAALAQYEACRTIRLELQDTRGLAAVLNGLGEVAREQGQFDHAVAYYQESLALKRELADAHGTARTLCNLALALTSHDDADAAIPLLEEALDIFRQMGDHGEVARALGNLGEAERRRGSWKQAQSLLREAAQIHHAMGNQLGSAFCLGNLGDIAAERGRFSEALVSFQEALTIYADAGVQLGVAQSIEGIARARGALGDMHDALKLAAAATNLRRVLTSSRDRSERLNLWQLLRQVRRCIGKAEARADWLDGVQLSPAQATTLAMANAKCRSDAIR